MGASLLTPRQVAEALNVDVGTVRLWLRERRLASVKLSRLRRVPRAEVERAMREGIERPKEAS